MLGETGNKSAAIQPGAAPTRRSAIKAVNREK
jgi:hypothetical protein